MRSSQSYVVYDPNTGQQYTTTMAAQPQGYPQYQQPAAQGFELYGQGNDLGNASAQQSYAQQQPATPDAANETIPQRGLFTARRAAPAYVVQQPAAAQQPYAQYGAPAYPQYQQPQTPYAAAAPYGYGYASASPYAPSYTLDAGDKLRIVVFGQDGITNSYIVDAGGNINLPLIGIGAGARRHHAATVAARSPSGSSRAMCASRMSRSRSRPTGRSSSSARSPRRGSILTSPT